AADQAVLVPAVLCQGLLVQAVESVGERAPQVLARAVDQAVQVPAVRCQVLPDRAEVQEGACPLEDRQVQVPVVQCQGRLQEWAALPVAVCQELEAQVECREAQVGCQVAAVES